MMFSIGDIVVIEDGVIDNVWKEEPVDLSGAIGLIESFHFENMEEKTGEMMYHVKHFIPPVGGVCLSGDKIRLHSNPEKAFLSLWCVIDNAPQDKYTSSVFHLCESYKYWGDSFPKGTRGIIVNRLWDKCYQSVLFLRGRAFVVPVEENYFKVQINV